MQSPTRMIRTGFPKYSSRAQGERFAQQLAELDWPLLRDDLGLPPDTPLAMEEYKQLALGFSGNTIAVLHRYPGRYYIYVEMYGPDDSPVRDETYAWRPESKREELFEFMRTRGFMPEPVSNEARSELKELGFK